MSLNTHSKFYYSFEVTENDRYIDFSEGSGELTAELEIGSYSLTDFLVEIERALNAAGALTYTATVNRSTRVITIAAGSTFSLLVSTGSHLGTSAFSTAGFTGADRTAASTYSGVAAGSVYSTQFILQSYVSSEDQRGPAYGVVNKAASGNTEVVTYGSEMFVNFNLKYVTNQVFGAGAPIRNNATGLEDLRTFMRFLITKSPVEFMPDESVPGTFETLLLESTPEDKNGLRYKLRELYDQNLPGFYETGALKFRVIE